MKNKFNIDGNFWINKEEKPFLGKGRVELLKNIQIFGSISKAAKHMKMSYKAAWDSVDIMNKLAKEPLVTKVTGGKGGGGTIITTYAKEIINAYDELTLLHKNYLDTLNNSFNNLVIDLKNEEPVFSRLKGTISNIISKEKNYEIEINLNSNQKLITVSNESFIVNKKLKLNSDIQILIETSSIVITKEIRESSARNSLYGKIINITNDDGINTYLSIDCGYLDIIYVKITKSSFDKLCITINDYVYASFKAYNINII